MGTHQEGTYQDWLNLWVQMEGGRWRDASPMFTFGDTGVPVVNVGSGSSRESEVLFILLSECIQVSTLALASSFMRSNKKCQQLLLNLIK